MKPLQLPQTIPALNILKLLSVLLCLNIGLGLTAAPKYDYIADSPVADVIFCSETPNEHGMINRKNWGDWTIENGDTVTVVGRKVVQFFTDSVQATNIYAVIDDNGRTLYTEARFLRPVDPKKDFFAQDKFQFNKGSWTDFLGQTWDLRSQKGRMLYSIVWPILVVFLMLLCTMLTFRSMLLGYGNNWLIAAAALSAFASIALLAFLTYHLGQDVVWWCSALYRPAWQSIVFSIFLGLFMVLTWYNFVFLYIATTSPIWTSFATLLLAWPIIALVSLLLFHFKPELDAQAHSDLTIIISVAICIGLPCLYGLIRAGWLGMIMPPVYMAMLYSIFWMFFVFTITVLIATGVFGALLLTLYHKGYMRIKKDVLVNGSWQTREVMVSKGFRRLKKD